jgi:hypothetical protein
VILSGLLVERPKAFVGFLDILSKLISEPKRRLYVSGNSYVAPPAPKTADLQLTFS